MVYQISILIFQGKHALFTSLPVFTTALLIFVHIVLGSIFGGHKILVCIYRGEGSGWSGCYGDSANCHEYRRTGF